MACAYGEEWLGNPLRFEIDPALPLVSGPRYTDKPLFGAFGDSAPDRWGRELIHRAERWRAGEEGRRSRAMSEVDFLLGVSDAARQGALRYTDGSGLFLSDKDEIPPLVSLPRLLAASERILRDGGSQAGLRLLPAPGSSLGGARPKAAVIDQDGHLALAKFSTPHDVISVERWETVLLDLAERAGVPTLAHRLESAGGRPVLISRRFDRDQQGCRIPFISAMTLPDADDGGRRSYAGTNRQRTNFVADLRAERAFLRVIAGGGDTE